MTHFSHPPLAAPGLLKLTLHCAQLLQVRRDRPYFAVLSIGSQTLTSARIRAPAHEDVCLTWEASSHFVLQRSGPTLARVAIYRGGKYKGALNNFLEVGNMGGRWFDTVQG